MCIGESSITWNIKTIQSLYVILSHILKSYACFEGQGKVYSQRKLSTSDGSSSPHHKFKPTTIKMGSFHEVWRMSSEYHSLHTTWHQKC
jgi:hypothetical protein